MSEETKTVTAEEVRVAFPQCVAFANEMRAVFGDGVKAVYMSEGGRELGALSERPDDKVVTVAQMDFTPLVDEPVERKGKHG